jgi:hypothetical protein
MLSHITLTLCALLPFGVPANGAVTCTFLQCFIRMFISRLVWPFWRILRVPVRFHVFFSRLCVCARAPLASVWDAQEYELCLRTNEVFVSALPGVSPTPANIVWSVWRRYSAFQALDKKVQLQISIQPTPIPSSPPPTPPPLNRCHAAVPGATFATQGSVLAL